MSSKIQKESDGSYTVSVNVKFEGSMLEMEDKIQEMVNEMGLKATLEALKQFDTSGESIQKGSDRLTSKGSEKKSSKHHTDKE